MKLLTRLVRRQAASLIRIACLLLLATAGVGSHVRAVGVHHLAPVPRGARPPSAALVATIHVGPSPTVLGVDERNGRVFVLNQGRQSGPYLTGPGTMSMLDAATGAISWTTTLGFDPYGLAVDGRNGRAFIVSAGRRTVNGMPTSQAKLTVLDSRTGRLVVTHPGVGGLTVDEAAGRVYLARDNGAISGGVDVLDAASGRVLRHIPGPFGGAITVDPRAHRAFVSNSDGGFTVLDTAQETVLGTTLAALNPQLASVDTRAARVFYFSGGDTPHLGHLNALDARSGAFRYDFQTGQGYPNVAAVDERLGRVYVDVTNGPTPTGIAALDSATGRESHITPLGQVGFPTTPNGAQSIAADEVHGQVFVLTVPFTLDHNGVPRHGPARLVMFDAATGAVSSSVGVGKDPQAVVVDTRLRRVFVADRGDDTVSVFDATKL
jgi:DNA-binding beta-propeller fold protein YncE